jgi:DNA-binding transcriptional MerR regulator
VADDTHGADDVPWRIDDLARLAGVGVDTIRYYRKIGILPAPRHVGRVARYGPPHLARLRRIREMRDEGMTLALVKRRLDADPPADGADGVVRTGAEEFLTLDELAARCAMPAAFLDAMVRIGVLVPRRRAIDDGPDVAVFTTADVDAVRLGLTLLEHGLPVDGLMRFAEDVLPTMRDIATRCVDLFEANVRTKTLDDPTLDAGARAERTVEAFGELLPAATKLIAHHFQRVLVDEALRHMSDVATAAERRAIDDRATKKFEVLL